MTDAVLVLHKPLTPLGKVRPHRRPAAHWQDGAAAVDRQQRHDQPSGDLPDRAADRRADHPRYLAGRGTGSSSRQRPEPCRRSPGDSGDDEASPEAAPPVFAIRVRPEPALPFYLRRRAITPARPVRSRTAVAGSGAVLVPLIDTLKLSSATTPSMAGHPDVLKHSNRLPMR
jgi:hypothetical protein